MAEPKLKTTPTAGPAPEPGPAWQKPKGLSKAGWITLAAVVALINLPLLHRALRGAPEASVAIPYEDKFTDRSTVKDHYFSTGGLWRIVNGELFSPGVKNNPLWLKARLPENVVIEFDVRCASPEGDVRVEIFGNGVDHLSGYELIHGGWNNSQSAIVRLQENARTLASLQAEARQIAARKGMANSGLAETGVYQRNTEVRVEGQRFPVRPNQVYHWRIERRGSLLRWVIDGQTYLEFDDPFPLRGNGHDRFGFSSNESDLYYRNLRILPLASSTDPGPPAFASPSPAPKAPPGPFADSFDRASLGPDWLPTNPAAVQLDRGSLTLQGAHNRPVWLTKPIPTNAAIEFDCWTDSPEGDLKVEVWGDGTSFHGGNPNQAYTSTGYVFILGGWRNTLSVLAKGNEHASDRVSRSDLRVQPGHRYHWRITRQGGRISWSIDGQDFLALTDSSPWEGPEHQYFAFSNFETKVHFDNLRIEAL
jgi:hypothetical protein